MESLIALIIAIVIGALVSGFIIWVVSKLGLGLTVENFGSALIAGLLIGIINNLVMQFVPGVEGWIGAVVHLVVAALVIMLAGALLSGLAVNGFIGALVAAVAIAAIQFLLGFAVLGGLSTVAGSGAGT